MTAADAVLEPETFLPCLSTQRPHVSDSSTATKDAKLANWSENGVTILPDDPKNASFQTSVKASNTGKLCRGFVSTKCLSISCAPAKNCSTMGHPNTMESGFTKQ
jgi:hypothetical protein